MSGPTLAEMAYNAYTVDGPRPMWEAIGVEQQQRWRRAALAVCNRCEHPSDRELLEIHEGMLDEIFEHQITGDEPDEGEAPEDFAIRYIRWLETRVNQLRELLNEAGIADVQP